MRVHSGDQPAEFQEFFRDAYSDALKFAQRRAEGPERAEDAVAEAFLVTWRRWSNAPTEPGPRRAWLFGIIRNTLLNDSRGTNRQIALAVRLKESSERVDSWANDPAETTAQRVDLVRAWARLDARDQETLALGVLEELSATEAAQVLGISRVAYRARLSRARRKLHSHLSEPSTRRSRIVAQEARS